MAKTASQTSQTATYSFADGERGLGRTSSQILKRTNKTMAIIYVAFVLGCVIFFLYAYMLITLCYKSKVMQADNSSTQLDSLNNAVGGASFVRRVAMVDIVTISTNATRHLRIAPLGRRTRKTCLSPFLARW